MKETWYFRGTVLMARVVICPFCDAPLQIPRSWTATAAVEWFEEAHLPVHVEEMLDLALPKCSRCQRYAAAGIDAGTPLHRGCYNADCPCECSIPAATTPEFSDGTETE